MASSEASRTPAEVKDPDIPPAIGTEMGKAWTDSFFRSAIRGAIRKIYFRWPGKKAVLARTRVTNLVPKKDGKGTKKELWHVCELCQRFCKAQLSEKQKELLKPWKKERTKTRKALLPDPPRPDVPYQIWCDHIDPVVSLDGTLPDWHTYIMRTFVDPSKMQAICDECHENKTRAENTERRQNVKERVAK